MMDKERSREDLLKEIEDLKILEQELKQNLEEEKKRHSEAEEALKKSEQQARALIKAVPDLIFRMNSSGVYLDYKANREDLYYQAESIIGKNNRDITPVEFADLVEQKTRQTLKTRQMQVFEYHLHLGENSEPNEYEARMVPSGPDEIIAIVRDITSRKKSERDLLIRETNVRTIIESSPNYLCLIDVDGMVIDCNQTLASSCGLSPTEMTGRCIFDFLPQDEIDTRRKFVKNVFEEGKPVVGETIILGRSVRYFIHPILNEKGIVIRVTVHAYDNTEHKAARKSLRENEEIFTRFLENSPIYVFFKDVNIRPIKLSRNYESLLGKPIEEILGKTMVELFPSDLAENMVKDDLKVLRERNILKVEESFNGRLYSTIKFPVIIDDVPKYLAGYTIDTTEQSLAEKALRENEEKFKKVYAEGTLPIAMLNGDFRFVSANQVFQDTFGYSEDELKEMTFKEITHPEHLAKDMDNLGLLLQRKIDIYHTEKRYITKNKEIVWGKAQVSIVRDSYNEFLYFLVMINDITSYKLAESEIKNKNRELEKLNAEKDKFFSIIAHDLRSPFNSFLGLTEIMAEELYSMRLDEIQRIATDLKNSANNLYHLLENLLEWSMVKRGIKPFNPTHLILKKLITENLLTVSESVRKKSIKLYTDVPEYLSLSADENMLGTIVRNLLSNAVKFTPKGGRISVRTNEPDDTTIELIIEDNGIGMDEKMKNTLFDLSGHNNRTGTEGELTTGLGLLLCKEFVEKHKGSIRVESEPDKGSTFIVKLKR
ncbi:MAG: PAS domain S-box protein [Bacteroidales bacterium]|nr:PAS domain S-box protein [Bacteroidales bacterium]